MNPTLTLDERTIDAGYPSDRLETLVDQSQEQYDKQIANHGPGKDWLHDEARFHIWKCCDELYQARSCVHNGEYEEAVPHFADALNHMLFSMEICYMASSEEEKASSNR